MFFVLGAELYNEEMKGKQLVKHTLISGQHVTCPLRTSLRWNTEPAVLTGTRGGLGGEARWGRMGQGHLFGPGLVSRPQSLSCLLRSSGGKHTV